MPPVNAQPIPPRSPDFQCPYQDLVMQSSCNPRKAKRNVRRQVSLAGWAGQSQWRVSCRWQSCWSLQVDIILHLIEF